MAKMAEAAYWEYGQDGSDPDKVGKGFREMAEQGFRFRFYGGDRKKSTQALIASRGDTIILSFRGTEKDDPNDYLAAADFALTKEGGLKGHVHRGFRNALLEVWSEVEHAIQEIRRTNPNAVVHISGHSLGASLATIAAVKLDQKDIPVGSVFTFGSSRVGDPNFAAFYLLSGLGEKTWRFRNTTDPLPHVPPTTHFHHVGTELYF